MTTTGRVAILHTVHSTIAEAQVVAVIGAGSVVYPIRIEPIAAALGDAHDIDWRAAASAQERLVNEKIRPLLREHPECGIAYFGAAPIPLAIHLGQLVESWSRVEAFQQHHASKEWAWSASTASPSALPTVTGAPLEVVHSSDDVVVRVSVSHRIDAAVTRSIVDSAMTEIDIAVAVPNPDVLGAPCDLDAIARELCSVLDAIAERRPETRIVHLFAAIPCGLAFRLGTMISPTKHPPVQLYQYQRGRSAGYVPALRLNTPVLAPRSLSADDLSHAQTLRHGLAQELNRLAAWIAACARPDASRPPGVWWSAIVPDVDVERKLAPNWRALASAPETPLSKSTVGTEDSPAVDGFRYDEGPRRWELSDQLLANIGRRLGNASRGLRAGRMLLLHEGVHVATHGLTTATADRVGRFPKVVEELDYQADVWAMLHEFAFTRAHAPEDAKDVRQFFLEMIEVALETFWAFDDQGVDLDEIPIRRLNRYLIWYWQKLRLQSADTLDEIVSVLLAKPLLEIAGPAVRTRGERVVYDLDSRHHVDLEIALVKPDQRLIRVGSGPASKVADILTGFRGRDGERIAQALKSVFDAHGR
jgi:hypothetical protein